MRFQLRRDGLWLTSTSRTKKRWSWMSLLPISLLFTIFLFALLFQSQPVVRNFMGAVKRNPAALPDAIDMFIHVNRVSIENLLYSHPESQISELPTLSLYTQNNTLTNMQQSLREGARELGHAEGGNKPYYKALLVSSESSTVQHVKIAIRGANSWHHSPEKPSLRVRIKKAEITGGRRYLELSRPEDPLGLTNYIPDFYARKIGLLADVSELVRLFINNKYYGVYLQSMRHGESLALANGRLPGMFFKADFVEGMWDSVEVWSKTGEITAEETEVFDQFLKLLKLPPTAQHLDDLFQFLDFEVYAKWAAIMALTGSHHTDERHNQAFYLGSTRGKIEAIPWDFNSFYMHLQPTYSPDFIMHPVMDRASRDPRYIHRRNQLIYQMMAQDMRIEDLLAFIDNRIARMRSDLESDVNLSSFVYSEVGLSLLPWSVADIDDKRDELHDWITQRYSMMSTYLEDARVAVRPHSDKPGWSHVSVLGSVTIRVSSSSMSDLETNSNPADMNILYPGLTEDLHNYAEFIYKQGPTIAYAKPAAMLYEVHANPGDLRFANAITGEAATLETFTPVNPAEARTIHPGGFRKLPAQDIILGPGEVKVSADLHTAEGQRLIIMPGTTLRIAPKVGIYPRGPTIAQGTENQPIIILPSVKGQPWAAFGISGLLSAGSVFEHVKISGGSIGTSNQIRFSGMLSAYRCPTITLKNCSFSKNFIGDDMVHLSESTVRVEGCEFDSARADALDLDMCEGSVVDCRFVDSGNDGLDLMSSRIHIRGTTFMRSGDKGISIGEGTELYVENSVIDSCQTGAQIKDQSRALFDRVQFINNSVGLHSYQKKWLYKDAGQSALVQCTFSGSKQFDLSLEKRSSAVTLGTTISSIDQGSKRVTSIDVLPSEWIKLRGKGK